MPLINQVLLSGLECRVKPQFSSSNCKIPNTNYLVMKFYKILPCPFFIPLTFGSFWISRTSSRNFANPCRSNQLQKCLCQCLPYLNPLRAKYLIFRSKVLKERPTMPHNYRILPRPNWSLQAYERRTLGKLLHKLGVLFPEPQAFLSGS